MRVPLMNAGSAPGGRRRSLLGRLQQFLRLDHAQQRFHAWLQKLCHRFGPPERQQQAHTCVVQNGRLPSCILLNSVRAKRRIDRHRHRPRQQNSRVANEKLPRRRQHQRHAPARGYSPARQLLRAVLRRQIQLPESQRVVVFAPFVVFGDQQVGSLSIVHAAIADQFQKRFRFLHDRVGRFLRQLSRRHGCPQPRESFFFRSRRTRRRHNGHSQLFRRARFRRQGVRQAHTKRALEPRQQLHAFETSQSEITIQIRVRGKVRHGAMTAKFLKQASQHVQNALSHARQIQLWGDCRQANPSPISSA